MRPRRKHLKSSLPDAEARICERLGEARRRLGLDQATAARKIGIPKSTLSTYELGVAPLKSEIALLICQKLIVNEEWLATGAFTLTEKVAKERGIGKSAELEEKVYFRQCMDLAAAKEARALPKGTLFSAAFKALAPYFLAQIRRYFHFVGISQTSWADTDLELGSDIAKVMIDRALLLVGNEAVGRNASPEHAQSVLLGFLLRMTLFGFKKCMEEPVSVADVGMPVELFTNPALPIAAFKTPEELHAAKEFAPIVAEKKS